MMHTQYKMNKRVMIVEVIREEYIKKVIEVYMDVIVDEDMEEGKVYPPLFLTFERLAMYKYFVPNHVLYMGIVISLNTL
jgi:hypothetical protein